METEAGVTKGIQINRAPEHRDTILNFINALGESVWTGGVFDYRATYQQWKRYYLPKNIEPEVKSKLASWNSTVMEWVNECLPQILTEGVSLFLHRYLESNPELMKKPNNIKDFSEHVYKRLQIILADELNKLTINIAQKVSEDTFLLENFSKLNLLSDFILLYLQGIIITDKQDHVEFFDIWSLNLETKDVKNSRQITSDDIDFLSNEFIKIIPHELESVLENRDLILTNSGQVRDIQDFDRKSKKFSLAEPFSSFCQDMVSDFRINKGKSWHGALSNETRRKIIEFKSQNISGNFQSFLVEHISKQLEIKLNLACIGMLISSSKKYAINIPAALSANEQISLFVKTKYIFYCAIYNMNIYSSLFIHGFIHPEDCARVKGAINSQFQQLMIIKRDQFFKVNFVVLPHLALTGSWIPPAGNYISYLPSNYTFPTIANKNDLLSALNLSETSEHRHFKSLVRHRFFKPIVKIKTIEAAKAELKKENCKLLPKDFVKTSVLGDEQYWHFVMHKIGMVTIRYKLHGSGIVDPLILPLSSYDLVLKRLDNFKQEIIKYKQYKNLDDIDKDIAIWMLDIINVKTNEIEKINFDNHTRTLLLHMLACLTLCLIFAEGIRNKGSFVTHMLVLQKIAIGQITFREAIAKYFPMAPVGNAPLGRQAHAKRLLNNSFFKGKVSSSLSAANTKSASKVREFEDREIEALMLYEKTTLSNLEANLRSFWTAEDLEHLKNETKVQKKLFIESDTKSDEESDGNKLEKSEKQEISEEEFKDAMTQQMMSELTIQDSDNEASDNEDGYTFS